MEKNLLNSIAEFLVSLTPSFIGAAVAQAWKPLLPWPQRLLQWVVGSAVSYYATIAVIAATSWSGFVAQSIAFAIALMAFDATPRVAKSITDTLVGLPHRLADKFLPKRKDEE